MCLGHRRCWLRGQPDLPAGPGSPAERVSGRHQQHCWGPPPRGGARRHACAPAAPAGPGPAQEAAPGAAVDGPGCPRSPGGGPLAAPHLARARRRGPVQTGCGRAGALGHGRAPVLPQPSPRRHGAGRLAARRAPGARRQRGPQGVLQYPAGGHPAAAPGCGGPQLLAHRAVLCRGHGRVWLGSLARPALGWAASAPRTGQAGLQFSGAPALAARHLGGLFPPLESGRPSPRSIARCCCGSSKTSCYGSSPPTRSPISAPGRSNEVVLGGEKSIGRRASQHEALEALGSLLLPCAVTRVSLRAVGCLLGATPRGQPWPSPVTLPQGRHGRRVWRMAGLPTCRALSLCRHVHRE
jgi:hypothetical protein